jgi:hypothetical protein
VAAQTASARIGDYLPRPAIIIALGLVASLDPAGAALVVQLDPGLMLRAAAAALVAVAFALHLALFGPWLRDIVDIDRFRFGSAVALGVLPLGLFGLVPGDAPLALAVLGMTFLFAFDPEDSVADFRSGGEGDDESDGDEYDSVGPASADTVAEEDHAPWL